MRSGYIDDVLEAPCKSAQEFSSVKDLKVELGCSSYLFVMGKDGSGLNEIIRLKIVDICSYLAVIDRDPLLFEDLCPLRRMVVRASDNRLFR